LVLYLLGPAFIEYPDIVRVNLKVNSLNSPKQVLAKQDGKLAALLVHEGQMVNQDQPLAYFETTGTPIDVIKLSKELKSIQTKLLTLNTQLAELPTNLNLGELQSAYQSFYQEYLQYKSTQSNGYYLKRMAFLQKDLRDISALKQQILQQQTVQLKEYANQESEYKAYQKLYKNNVISRSEFAQQENRYLNSKYPLQQTEASILNNAGSYTSKEKELLDLQHTINDEKGKFAQSLKQCLMETDSWIFKYILRAPVSGKLSFAGIVQQNQNVLINQELFVINPGNTDFFGEVQIPQYNMGKIEIGERALIKLRSYPFEQYGMIRGRLSYISDVAYRDSVFVAKISFDHFENKDQNRKITLKNGMQGEAEIVTEESSLLRRFFRNITKIIK
jgi:multidrug efflux pump subunit AcrA (membrane-fusion protein)